mgnify:CR=1 FL=1
MSEIRVGSLYVWNDPHTVGYMPIVRVIQTTLQPTNANDEHLVHKIQILGRGYKRGQGGLLFNEPQGYCWAREITDPECEAVDYALDSELMAGPHKCWTSPK